MLNLILRRPSMLSSASNHAAHMHSELNMKTYFLYYFLMSIVVIDQILLRILTGLTAATCQRVPNILGDKYYVILSKSIVTGFLYRNSFLVQQLAFAPVKKWWDNLFSAPHLLFSAINNLFSAINKLLISPLINY